jgi:hypothetical protein
VTIDERKELMLKTIEWYNTASRAIWDVGGHPPSVIAMIPQELLYTMISNGLYIKR